MKLAIYSLYLGGALHIGWAVFHVGFSRIFKWDQALAKLDIINRNVYQIINWCLAFWFFAAAYLTLKNTDQLLTTPLGRRLTAIMAAFWLFRFLLQLRYFKITQPVSMLLGALFLITMSAYLVPLIIALGQA